jgi:hypothetical protein
MEANDMLDRHRRINVRRVASTNPQVDTNQLREAKDLIDTLRRAGVPGKGYGLAQPYQRRPLHRSTESGDESDPNT